MKNNIIKISVSLFSIILLTGCGEKYLTCDRVVVNNDDLVVNEMIKLKYQRTKLLSSSVYTDYTFKNKNQTDIDSMKEALNEECTQYKDMDGVKCNVSNISDGLHFELVLEPDKISNENKTYFEEMLNYGTYADSETKLRKSYNCN